jgi:hypothetical protein
MLDAAILYHALPFWRRSVYLRCSFAAPSLLLRCSFAGASLVLRWCFAGASLPSAGAADWQRPTSAQAEKDVRSSKRAYTRRLPDEERVLSEADRRAAVLFLCNRMFSIARQRDGA